MAIDIDGARASAPLAGGPAVPDRPAPPDTGPGRWVRILVGVRERILDWVPEERARYTGLGIIVLNTGVLAALAMLTAMGRIVSGPVLAFIPLALLWGWIIISIDRWLITSTHGVHPARSMLKIFAPRLLLTVLLALTIAELLTLRIFQPALDRQVRQTQVTQITQYESRLQNCNPPTGEPDSSRACNGYRLSIKNPSGDVTSEISASEKQRGTLQGEVNTIETNVAKLQNKAEDECAGTKGPGLSGVSGFGPRCRSDLAAVTSYSDSSGLAAKQALLKSLNQKIDSLISTAGPAQAVSAAEVSRAVSNAVQAKKKTQQGEIGLLDEWNALGQLSAKSTFVNYAHWLLRLLLIALDSLPITAKMMSGSTAYDRLLTSEIESAERISDIDIQLREQYATADKEIDLQIIQIRKQDRLRRLDHDQRIGRAQQEADLVRSAEELATQWIRDARQF
jgi:hypothetical protein